ncbi:spore germination protein [Desulfotomaculum arcticum]|uniref:Spore germination protein n=1 Tax=Desulfotruncus arcticus DSM 17038 TaxID=1121424 RepID=A0A1I2P0H0_9FIRM|nr:endospore germination permease [Desulfotruncus arcticus]SFG09143.1 spore germination protein [Desulfotomaculum arcticum] [Desulfotruncus arcticus DSM 17038]
MSNQIKDRVADLLDPKVMGLALVVGITEFELFIFSKGVVRLAGQDAWLSVLLGSLILLLTTYLLLRLAARFPRQNLFQYNRAVWGRPIAWAIALGFLIYWSIYLTLLLTNTAAANALLFLPRTPPLVPTLILVLAAAWLAAHGLPAVVRFFQLAFPFLLLPLLFIYLLALRSVDLNNFLPVLSNGILPVLKGAIYFAGAWQGLELILFLSPFLAGNPARATRSALLGAGLIVLFSFAQTVISIGIMGVENIQAAIWPGIETISALDLPGFPVERFELFLTLPWLVAVFTTIALFIYLLSYGISEIFHLPRHRKTITYITSFALVLAIYVFPNYIWVLKVREHFNYLTLFFVLALPLGTLILAVIRGKRGAGNA